jgi:hypothetical protein
MPVKNHVGIPPGALRLQCYNRLTVWSGNDSLEPNSKPKSRGPMSGLFSKLAPLLVAVSVCAPVLVPAANAQRGGVRKTAKKQVKKDPPALPAYTPAPLEPLPLDQTPAVAPQVSYQSGELSIVAHNSTLADVLRAVRKLTGAEMEVPPNATERVVADLGPGPAREVLAELLNGTHFNYVMVGSASDPSAVQSLMLTLKSSAPETASAAPPSRGGAPQRFPQTYTPPVPPQGSAGETASGDDAEDSADEDAAEAAEDQPAPPDQQNQASPQTPKTPEQLLQELQRQMQQQQQQPGQQPGNQPPQGLFPNQPPTQAPQQKPD